MLRAAHLCLAAVVACSPRDRVVARHPEEVFPVRDVPSPVQGVARFVVVSRGVRYERVHDGFGCTSGEVPGVDVIRARHGDLWDASLRLRFEGLGPPDAPPEGLPVQLPRGGATSMRSRAEAVTAATDGEVQACWSPDGTRFAWRTHHPAAMGANHWSRVEWTPRPRVVRWLGLAPDCARALTAPPDPDLAD